MLSTLIYRSRFNETVPFPSLYDMVERANAHNTNTGVTGILLYDGSHFFQLLEGPHERVVAVFDAICQDPRHDNVIELMRDHAPARRFGNVGMELFDLREHDEETVLQAVLARGTSKFRLTYSDRALQFLCTFVEGRERANYLDIPAYNAWRFVVGMGQLATLRMDFMSEYRFAFQPIVDPLSQCVVAWEAKMRDSDGGSPLGYFSLLAREEMYQSDLLAKRDAFRQAVALGLGDAVLTVKLLPMSLIAVPDAVAFLVQAAREAGLVPEQIVIAVTENGVIQREEAFADALRQLKASGLGLAIDDFGSGAAGLRMLTQFQPDRIMIDRDIVSNIHRLGPNQAVVLAILKFCTSLEVSVIASGVEKAEEWMWLEAAGVLNFQGELFAAPRLDGLPTVAWPESSEML